MDEPWRNREAEKLPRLRRYLVRTTDGSEEIHDSHYCFDNGSDGGLIFRRYIDDNIALKTRVVAAYAQGYWQTYKEMDYE